MPDQRKKRFPLGLVLALFLTIGAGVVLGLMMIRARVTAQFGPPSPNLTITQRLVYPMELFFNQAKLTRPQARGAIEQSFDINQGESVAMICIRLEKANLIKDAELMQIYLVYTGMDRQLKSGRFMLSPDLSPLEIASNLVETPITDAIVTVLPGWRIEEVANNIAGSGLPISANEFIELAYNPSPMYLAYLPVDSAPSLEGFLFPGTYVFPRETDLETVVIEILTTFSDNMDAALIEGFSRQGLSVYDALILASIVEKEAVVAEEKPLIASVFYNRLSQGIRLETDPTVQYALGFQQETQTWWKAPLFFVDLTVESPYNTYQNAGLPPTPISNPDLGSLRAVAFPAETPYYFFRAACDNSGRHNFSITFEEHLNYGCD